MSLKPVRAIPHPWPWQGLFSGVPVRYMGLLEFIRDLFARPVPKRKHRVTPTPMPTQGNDPRTRVIVMMNDRRKIRDLEPFVRDSDLQGAAQSWAESMANADVLMHGNFEDRIMHVVRNKAASEDIAEGQSTAEEVMDSWMKSPPHRAAILGPYSKVGVGVSISRTNHIYWCADFSS